MTNFEKLDAVIDYACDHPDEFNMEYWGAYFPKGTRPENESFCGTTACLAGTAVVLAGGRLLFTALESTGFSSAGSCEFGEIFGLSIAETGRRILGLTVQQAEHVFHVSSIVGVITYRNRCAEKDGVARRSWKVPTSMIKSWELGNYEGDENWRTVGLEASN